MKFDELDQRMRVFETAHDHCVLPGLWMVARLDGRGFTRLTKELHAFEAPFDERFRDAMVDTAEHLMNCGFGVLYGYTECDEISLLLQKNEMLSNEKACSLRLNALLRVRRDRQRRRLPVALRDDRLRRPTCW